MQTRSKPVCSLSANDNCKELTVGGLWMMVSGNMLKNTLDTYNHLIRPGYFVVWNMRTGHSLGHLRPYPGAITGS